jgi:hypothetical protein
MKKREEEGGRADRYGFNLDNGFLGGRLDRSLGGSEFGINRECVGEVCLKDF